MQPAFKSSFDWVDFSSPLIYHEYKDPNTDSLLPSMGIYTDSQIFVSIDGNLYGCLNFCFNHENLYGSSQILVGRKFRRTLIRCYWWKKKTNEMQSFTTLSLTKIEEAENGGFWICLFCKIYLFVYLFLVWVSK